MIMGFIHTARGRNMVTTTLRTVLRSCIGEQWYDRVRSMRRQLKAPINNIKEKAHIQSLNKAKAQVDTLLEEDDISRLYLAQSVPYLFDAVPDKRQMFDKLWNVYRNPATHLRDPVRLVQFMSLLEIANAAPEGDYLEIGTHRGESAKVIFTLMEFFTNHVFVLIRLKDSWSKTL